ncbi:MAG: sigma-70 family RNA polymerase sigma factor [Anaerolineae bacterium]|nr:sigma-70 family RNA polymerase sigma factor [Anaerolineae bacterium]
MGENTFNFQEIYETFQPKIMRYLLRLVGEQEAEDLTQEVFVKVSRALPDFRGDSSLSTWLYRIATHAAIDRLRSTPPPAIIPDESDETSSIEEKNPLPASPEDQLVRKQMNECIWNFIQVLPEQYRTVFILSELEGLSNAAIAEILEITLSMVKIRLHRARAKLKSALMAHCDSYWVEGNAFVPDLRRAVKVYQKKT